MDLTPDARTGLQASLRAAMRARDAPATRALRSVLAAIANAEAVPPPASSELASDSPIAGAASGLGAGDVARRALTDADVEAILRAEIVERVEAATEYDRHAHPDRAAALREEAGVLERHLVDSEAPPAPGHVHPSAAPRAQPRVRRTLAGTPPMTE